MEIGVAGLGPFIALAVPKDQLLKLLSFLLVPPTVAAVSRVKTVSRVLSEVPVSYEDVVSPSHNELPRPLNLAKPFVLFTGIKVDTYDVEQLAIIITEGEGADVARDNLSEPGSILEPGKELIIKRCVAFNS